MKKITKKEKTEKVELVTKKMRFAELIANHPESAGILMNKGMHCFGCAMASYETLEEGCLTHGLNPDEIVSEINKKIKGRK